MTIDVGRVNDRVFINNSSIGIYPGMVELREELREQGHRKWTAMAIATGLILAGSTGQTGTAAAVRQQVSTTDPWCQDDEWGDDRRGGAGF